MSGGTGQTAQDIVQNTAIPEVFDLILGVDPAENVHVIDTPVGALDV
jgi:hypothetical protein